MNIPESLLIPLLLNAAAFIEKGIEKKAFDDCVMPKAPEFLVKQLRQIAYELTDGEI